MPRIYQHLFHQKLNLIDRLDTETNPKDSRRNLRYNQLAHFNYYYYDLLLNFN